MRISQVFRFRRHIVAGLIVPLFLWSVDAAAFAVRPADEEIKVTIKAVEVKPNVIIIDYELAAPASESYEINLMLLREGSPWFKVPVRAASGDIGKGKFSGGTRQIRWEYAKDYPAGLQGDGFYFEIAVTKVTGSNLLLYLGLGALAVVGGGVAILAGGKKEGAASSPTATELPPPPARPSQ